MSVAAVHQRAAIAAVDAASRGEGPTLIEAITYRIEAHTNADDASRYRDDAEVQHWLARDPIDRLQKYLLATGELPDFSAEAEEFAASAEGRSFDHILVLRSWNHLRDPGSVLERLRTLLKPGGSLLIVDNAAFGLARTGKQTARAEAGPAEFEHYRNDIAADATRLVDPLGFTLVEKREVGPATSNQWLLRYSRPAA